MMSTRILLAVIAIVLSANSFGQTFLDSTINSSTKRILFADPNAFAIGSYGEAHYNQPFESGTLQNGTMDLHRIILFMGYKFNSKFQFFTEIEFEHVKEVYVEQAFLNYSFNNYLNFKAGVILIPMGYVNEFHEPTLFNGVERSSVDKYIIPSTWREMGAGFHGIIKKANLKYQLYAVNGFKGYDGSAKFNGSGLRSGRQNAGKTIARTPSVTGKLTFYGLNGLRVGISGYHGMSETSLYDGLDRNDPTLVAVADSSRVGISMAAANIHYTLKNFRFLFVGNLTSLGNTDQYNAFTGANVAKQIMGYYGEVAYHYSLKKGETYPKLIPFVRYENYDTHFKMERPFMRDAANHKEILTGGVGLQLTPGTIFKTDFQWIKTEAVPRPVNLLNVGFGYWF